MTPPRDASYPYREHLKTTLAVPPNSSFPEPSPDGSNYRFLEPESIQNFLVPPFFNQPSQSPDCPSTPTPRPPWPNTTPNPPPPTTLPPNPSTSTNPPTRPPSRATAPLPKPPPPNTLTATPDRKTLTANPKAMPTVVVRVPGPASWASAAAAERHRV